MFLDGAHRVRSQQLHVFQGCEVKLERLLQGVMGYAMLVILGFAIIKVKTVTSSLL